MPHVQHGRYAIPAWLVQTSPKSLAKRLFFHRFPVGDDLFLHEIAEGGDALGVTQFLGISEEHRYLIRGHFGQHAHELREVADQVIWQNADPEIVQHTLQNTEIVVHRQQ